MFSMFTKEKKAPTLVVYLAGPDVFEQNAKEIGEAKVKKLEQYNCQGSFPLDNEVEGFKFNRATALQIHRLNEQAMQKADVILVNMTPFRSPSLDVGTAFEAGFMSGKATYSQEEVLIIGYYEGDVNLNYLERVQEYFKVKTMQDPQNRNIENWGLTENLMLEGAIFKTGGKIFTSFEDAAKNVQPLWEKKMAAKAQQDNSYIPENCSIL